MSGQGRREFLRICGLAAVGAAAGKGGWELVRGEAEAAAAEPGRSGAPRWAMVLDPRKCLKLDGCRDCIVACHAAHNVPSIPDPRHEVKWIWKEEFPNAFPDQESRYVDPSLTESPVLVFCNHCEDPPCVRVCPTQATWKRRDGIVMMDWHRCIGCRYCMAACPYGSRSFNWQDPRPFIAERNLDFPTRMKGVVEKCTFCDEKIDRGETPVCVAACPEKAMVFGDLNDPSSPVREALAGRFALRRKAELGTGPSVYYLV